MTDLDPARLAAIQARADQGGAWMNREDVLYLLAVIAQLQTENARLSAIEADYIAGEDSEDGPVNPPPSRTVQVYPQTVIARKATPRVDLSIEKERLESGEYKALQRIEQLEADLSRLQAERDEAVANAEYLDVQRDRLQGEISEAREECPIVRRQDYFDASLLVAVRETVSMLFAAEAARDEAQRAGAEKD